MTSKFLAALFGRQTPLPVARGERPAVPRVNAYQAVTIVAAQKACAGALAVRQQRFLARQAPPLPLPQCDRPERCVCRYRKHAERRVGPQRVLRMNEIGRWDSAVDKRKIRDRRAAKD